MKKIVCGLKERYKSGLDWICNEEPHAQLVYIACIISEFLTLSRLESSNNVKSYAIILGVNLIFIYLLSFINQRLLGYAYALRLLLFVILEAISVKITENYFGFNIAATIFMIPIIVSCFVAIASEYIFILDNVHTVLRTKKQIILCDWILSIILPTIIIAIPMVFLEWNLFIKIIIVLSYIILTPFIAYYDAEGLNIFSAMGLEW